MGDRLSHFLNQWKLSVLRGGRGGSETSLPESTSIVISSSEHVSDEGPRQRSLQEEVRTLLLKGAVELVNPPLTPGFYSAFFLYQRKMGKWDL